jgi:SAM-dependent methyltransferase
MDDRADAETLRRGVRERYRDVALNPDGSLGSYTGRPLAAKLGYPAAIVDALPDRAVESFAGVSSPFSLRELKRGERVVDVGSGAGFDAFVAAGQVGDDGRVIGVDMTPEMIRKSRDTAAALGLDQVEFRDGLAENLPVEDGWADVVISNGVINLCADKRAVLAEIHRVLRPGGALQFADVATGRPVPAEARDDIDLRTFCIAGGLSLADWQTTLQDCGFTNVAIGPPIDNFGGTAGEEQARAFDVYGYTFLAFKAC